MAAFFSLAVTFERSAISEMNTHVFSGPRTREITEVGLHPYMLAVANDVDRTTGALLLQEISKPEDLPDWWR